MESRWAVNPKVRRGDHTFLMVSDFLTNPGFPADSCSVWVASGRMHVDIIVSHRWFTEFTGNGSNGEKKEKRYIATVTASTVLQISFCPG